MATVTYYCNDCQHVWRKQTKFCPKCECPDFYYEWDEWQDHVEPVMDKPEEE